MGVIRVEFSEGSRADEYADTENPPKQSDHNQSETIARNKPKRASRPKRIKIQKKTRATATPSDIIARSLRRKPGFSQKTSNTSAGTIIEQFLSEFLAPNIAPRPSSTHPELFQHAEKKSDHPKSQNSESALHQDIFWSTWMSQQDRLFKLSMKLLSGNVSDAEDALGVAMVNGCRAFSDNKIENPSAWLSRMVHNACIDIHRRRTRHATPTDSEELERLADRTPTVTPQTEDPESLLIGRQNAAELIDDLHQLPASWLEPLLMRCLGDMSYDQIGEIMNLNNATVRKRVELARKRLREMK